MQYLIPSVVGVAVIAGCGRVTTQPADEFGAGQRSGTRLKLEYFDFDGARQILSIQDSARQESCTFVQWADGNWYCTPVRSESVAFSDDKCTVKVGRGSSDMCSANGYFAEYTWDCDGIATYSHLYTAGSKIELTQYFALNDGVCTPTPAAGFTFYTLGKEVDTADLVRGTVAAEGTGRVQARFVTSTDGLRRALLTAFDSQIGVDCYPQHSGQCPPQTIVRADYFSEPTCATPAVLIDNRCPRKVAAEPNSCMLRLLGAQIPSSLLYLESPNGCTPGPQTANHSMFELGAPVSIATVTAAPVQSARRIRPMRFTELGSTNDIRMYDADKQAECIPVVLAGGGVYCFPAGQPFSNQYFTDRECKMSAEIMAVSQSPTNCAPVTVPKFATQSTRDTKACSTLAESRPVGALHSGQLWDKSTGLCAPSSVLSAYYDVGPPIPLSELAQGALVVDQ